MSGSSFRRVPCVVAMAILTLAIGASPASAALGPWAGQLSFHPSLPTAPPPTVTANPATKLLDRQLVRVRATGFTPGTNVVVQECKVKAPPSSDQAFCDAGTSLVDRQFVRVTGTKWTPLTGLFIQQCKVKDPPTRDPRYCDPSTTTQTQADIGGSVNVTTEVHRVIFTSNGRVDCATTPNGCQLRATVGYPYGGTSTGDTAVATHGFDSSVAPPGPPGVRVEPGQLADHQLAFVLASNLPPRAYVEVEECRTGFDDRSCDESTAQSVQTDIAGGFGIAVGVKRNLATAAGAVDCLQGFGCEMRVTVQGSAPPFGGGVVIAGSGSSWLPPGVAGPSRT